MEDLPNEGRMSHYFFNYVVDGHNAVDSFDYAYEMIHYHYKKQLQYPKIADNSNYVWFID